MIRRLIGYFFAGLALFLPIGLSIYLVYKVVIEVDSLLQLNFPGLGFLVVTLVITLAGMIASLLVGRSIFVKLESIVINTPIFGYIYKAFKDLTTAFVGKENKFSEPVMIKISAGEVYRIGFITSKNAAELVKSDKELLTDDPLYAVYLPLSYSLSGDLLFVPASSIKLLNISSKDAMQYVVSGGIIQHN